MIQLYIYHSCVTYCNGFSLKKLSFEAEVGVQGHLFTAKKVIEVDLQAKRLTRYKLRVNEVRFIYLYKSGQLCCWFC